MTLDGEILRWQSSSVDDGLDDPERGHDGDVFEDGVLLRVSNRFRMDRFLEH
jgi:hypothetical protein